jgi:predicted SAM-dependent methyltransferase
MMAKYIFIMYYNLIEREIVTMDKYKKIRGFLRPIKLKLQNISKTISYRFQRFLTPPILPQNKDGKVLIHLGCGPQNDPRYINVDGIPLPHVHYVSRVEKLPMFSKNFADLIYACHVFEHISHRKLIEVLHEWRRILKDGGILRLSVPDFDKIVEVYKKENDISRIIPPLIGTHENGRFDFHRAIFNKQYLSNLLKEAGFREVREWNPDTAPYYSFTDWAGPRKLHGIYPISLNIEGVK